MGSGMLARKCELYKGNLIACVVISSLGVILKCSHYSSSRLHLGTFFNQLIRAKLSQVHFGTCFITLGETHFNWCVKPFLIEIELLSLNSCNIGIFSSVLCQWCKTWSCWETVSLNFVVCVFIELQMTKFNIRLTYWGTLFFSDIFILETLLPSTTNSKMLSQFFSFQRLSMLWLRNRQYSNWIFINIY